MVCIVCMGCGLYTSRRGKFVVWAELLDQLKLQSDGGILDLSCGRSAVLLMAAQRLTTGRTVGADRWRKRDQSGNAAEATKRNAVAEGVADRRDLMSRDMAEVRHWLVQKDAHGDLVLPAGLDGRPSLGCRLLDWNGGRISLICFELENHQIAHLLVVDRNAFKDAPEESPEFTQLGEVATVSWSRGDKTYLVASKGGNPLDRMKLL